MSLLPARGPTPNRSTHIAVVGLGAVGSRVAARLLDAGDLVTVYNRSPEAKKPSWSRTSTSRLATAAQVGADVPITTAVRAQLARAHDAGDGGLDISGVARTFT